MLKIKDLAETISKETNFQGLIKYDKTKLSGQSQRIMDFSKMNNSTKLEQKIIIQACRPPSTKNY